MNNNPYDSNKNNKDLEFEYPSYRRRPLNNARDTERKSRDYGPNPFVVNINEATKRNNNFRTALWTGNHLQLTLMSIPVGGEIGLERHPDLDQFIRLEEGQGVVKMGDRKDRLDFQENVYDDFAFIIPAGTWHNLINTGNIPIKLYSIYAPPQHPHGTVHRTKEDAEAAETSHGYNYR
jgi:mannose-6-phosphate isomerase-like protein (cupin superfamily)